MTDQLEMLPIGADQAKTACPGTKHLKASGEQHADNLGEMVRAAHGLGHVPQRFAVPIMKLRLWVELHYRGLHVRVV
ncbi:hypothetical protein GCM10022631_10260 [Deinococcus rubellus]